MANDILIRPAGQNDIERMCSLLGELFAIEADFTPDSVKQERGLSRLIEGPSGNVLVLVAESGGCLAGMATVQTLVSTAEGERVGLVEDVIVGKTFRGQGIGTLLLEHIIEWARSRDLKRLQLLADRENHPALAFYASRKWTETNLMCMRMMV